MKAYLLLTTLLALLITACTPQEEAIEPVPASDPTVDLTGTWNLVRTEADELLFDINQDGVHTTDLLAEMPCRLAVFTLLEDSTCTLEYNSWTYQGGSGQLICTLSATVDRGRWEVLNGSARAVFIIEYDGYVHTSVIPLNFSAGELSGRFEKAFFNYNANGEQGFIFGEYVFRHQ